MTVCVYIFYIHVVKREFSVDQKMNGNMVLESRKRWVLECCPSIAVQTSEPV